MVEFTITEEVQIAINNAFGKMIMNNATKEEYDKFVSEIKDEIDELYDGLELVECTHDRLNYIILETKPADTPIRTKCPKCGNIEIVTLVKKSQ